MPVVKERVRFFREWRHVEARITWPMNRHAQWS
jgi:preprotein translocase subunit SecE